MASPIKRTSEQSKTITTLKDGVLDGANRPNYILVIKGSFAGVDPPQKTTIQTMLFRRLVDSGWLTQNTTTSTIYFMRSDVAEIDFVRAQKTFLTNLMTELHVRYDDTCGTHWGISYIITKPLSANEIGGNGFGHGNALLFGDTEEVGEAIADP